MAGVYRKLNPRRAQLRRAWTGTQAPVPNVYTKSGYGILGIPRTWPKAGYGIAGGLVGSGASQKIAAPIAKSGFGVAIGGGVGANSTAPSTPVLDDFNRANGALGSNWSGPVIHPSSLAIASNRVTGAVSGVANGAWNVNTFGPASTGRPVEAYWQMTTMANPGHSNTLLMVADTTGASTRGYAAVVNTFGVSIYRLDPGGSTQIDSTGITVVAGTYAWFIYRPSGAIELWLSTDFVTWTKRSFTTDATYLAVPLYIGGQFDDNTITSDNFGGGTVGVLLGSKQVIHSKSGFGSLGSGASVTDDFNRANGAPGANWTASTDGAFTIASNKAAGTSANVLFGSTYTAQARNNDQYAQITSMVVSVSGGNYVAPSVRSDSTGQNLYLARYAYNTGAPVIQLYKRVSGTFTQLGSNYVIPGGTGGISTSDVIRIEAVGTTIRAFLNNVAVVTATDSAIASGFAGLFINGDATADNWQSGDLVAFNGLVGSGPKQVDHIRSGFATVGGIGAGPENKVDQDTGYATVGGVGSGVEVYVPGTAGGNVYTKSGFAVAGGLVGSGSRQTDHIRSGFGIAGGLVGSGSRAVEHTRSGFGVAGGLVGSGFENKVDQDSGFATVGGIGSGPSASVFQETGFATVGGIGSGPSASVEQDSGFATVGGIGAGPKQVDHTRSGFGTVHGFGSGADAFTDVDTGFATVGGVGTGSRSRTFTKTGFATVGGIGSGPRQEDHNRSGFATVGGIGAGPSESVFVESGFGVAGTVGAGATFRQGVVVKAGAGFVGCVGSGTREVDRFKTGFGTVGGVGAGTKEHDTFKTGFGQVGINGAGTKEHDTFKTGFATVGGIGSGPSESTDVDSGFATVGGIGSGSSFKAGTQGKTGFATVGGIGSGPSASVEVDSGFATVGGIGAGVDIHIAVKSGFATVGGIGSGTKEHDSAKSGFATVGGVGSGPKQVTHQKSGFAVVGTVGSGASAKVTGASTHSGTGAIGAIGAGPSASVFVEAGAGIAGTVGSGSTFRQGLVVKSGAAIAGLVGSGVRVRERVRQSFATLAGVASGSKSMEHNRSSAGIVGLTALGARRVVFTSQGYAIIEGTGHGFRSIQNAKAGHGIVGTFAAGKFGTVFVFGIIESRPELSASVTGDPMIERIISSARLEKVTSG